MYYYYIVNTVKLTKLTNKLKLFLRYIKAEYILMIIKLKVALLFKMRYGSENIYLELVSTSNTI